MPVPIPGSKVGSDNQKVKFLSIFGRPKTRSFDKISGVLGRAPLATNHAALRYAEVGGFLLCLAVPWRAVPRSRSGWTGGSSMYAPCLRTLKPFRGEKNVFKVRPPRPPGVTPRTPRGYPPPEPRGDPPDPQAQKKE